MFLFLFLLLSHQILKLSLSKYPGRFRRRPFCSHINYGWDYMTFKCGSVSFGGCFIIRCVCREVEKCICTLNDFCNPVRRVFTHFYTFFHMHECVKSFHSESVALCLPGRVQVPPPTTTTFRVLRSVPPADT